MPITVTLTDGRTANFPDGTSQADMEAALQQLPPLEPVASHDAPSPPLGGWLPTAGGLVGSTVGTLAGPPGRIAGAAIGGALGKGAEMLLDDTPQSFREGLSAMGTEGATQGAYEVAGGAIGKGLKAVGGKIASVALNPIESVARKYPNLGQVYTREAKLFPRLRGGVGAIGTKDAVTQAAAARTGSRQASDAMLAAADAAGAPRVNTLGAVRGEFGPMLRNARTDVASGKPDLRPEIIDRVRRLTKATPDASLSEANVIRRRLDDVADKAFEASRKGAPINVTEASADKAIASGLRKRITAGAEQAGQAGYKAATTRTRELAGLTKALEKASTRKHLLTRTLGISSGIGGGIGGAVASGGDPTATVGGGAGTLAAAYLLTNPRALGRIALSSHGLGTLAEHVPAGARAALLLNALLEPQPPEESPR